MERVRGMRVLLTLISNSRFAMKSGSVFRKSKNRLLIICSTCKLFLIDLILRSLNEQLTHSEICCRDYRCLCDVTRFYDFAILK